jgi:putative proteasome-type protease
LTFCIGVRVQQGLVALADTQIVRGEQISSKAKLSRIDHGDRSAFLMTSGLRSVRDKTAMRLEDELAALPAAFPRMHQLASAFGSQLKRVREEDEEALKAGGLTFNLHAILGGQFAKDPEPTLFQVFPEGNWVDATPDSPYFIIGRTSYGKPILDRLLRYDTPLQQAVALAYLAFDATRASVVDVDFPIDVIIMQAGERELRRSRFTAADLGTAHDWWHQRLKSSLDQFPMDWSQRLWSATAATIGERAPEPLR